MRTRCVVVLLLLGVTLSCGERPRLGGEEEELGPPDSGATENAVSLAQYCAGGNRLQVNGEEQPVDVTGRVAWPTYANEQATLIFTPADDPDARVLLSFHVASPQGSSLPAALDLAALPDTWSVTLYAGCSPGEPKCSSPADVVASGLRGHLTVTGSFPAYSITACVESRESPSSPRPLLHSVRLWARHIPAVYDLD